MRPAAAFPLAATAFGLGATAYGWAYERKAFRLRRAEVPILPPGAPSLTVLHISDLHATPGQPWKVSWVRSLAELEPDLVVNTGDNLASHRANPIVLDALGPLLERPGVFVPGSNDWFAPVKKNPARYLLPDDGRRSYGNPLPWGELRSSFTSAGWLDLTHRRTTIVLRDVKVELGGVSDAHLKADHYDEDRRRDHRRRGDRAVALPGASGHRLVRGRRLLADDERAHPRRPAAGARLRRARDELRPVATPRPRPVTVGAGCLAARLRRPGDLAVRADPVRLPAGSDAAHPDAANPVSDLA